MKPNNNQPLETELVSSSFSSAYKTVMEMAKKLDSTAIDLSTQMSELVSEVETLTQQLADSVLELDTKIDETSDTINLRIDGEVATLNDRITTTASLLEAMLNQLKGRVDTHDVQITEIINEIILQGEALREGLAKIDAVVSSMETVQQEVATLTTLVSSYDDAIQSLDNRATSLEGSVTTINSQIETIDGFLQLASQEISAIKERLDAVEPRVTALETTTSSLSTSVATLDSEAVKTTGNQTIAGVKTFSDAPCIPSLASQTPVAVQSVVGFDSNGNLIAGEAQSSSLNPATKSTIGGVIVGDGLDVSSTGRLSVKTNVEMKVSQEATPISGYISSRGDSISFGKVNITPEDASPRFIFSNRYGSYVMRLAEKEELNVAFERINKLEQANAWQTFGDWHYRIQGDYLEAIYTSTNSSIGITNSSGNFYRSDVQTLDVPADILNGKTLTVVHATVNCGHSGYPVTTAFETITSTGITWFALSGSTRNLTGNYYITAKIEGFLS